MNYPISELFYSIQGEGVNMGRACLFIRLGGCNVGKRCDTSDVVLIEHLGHHPRRTLCTLPDQTRMACDTDYTTKCKLSTEEILTRLKQMNSHCKYVSITGGEPFLHPLDDLVQELRDDGFEIWIETSGTLQPTPYTLRHAKLVVSPKFGYFPSIVRQADHVKLLVSHNTEADSILKIAALNSNIWIQPVESPSPVESRANLRVCIDLVHMYPWFRLSPQIHKHLNVP